MKEICQSTRSIDTRLPYAEQETEKLGDEVLARLNPETNEVENLEVVFFSTRLLRSDLFELPITADLRLETRQEPSQGSPGK